MSGSGLSNSEFRVLMMTPRGGTAPSLSSSMAPPSSKPAKKSNKKKKNVVKPQNIKETILKKYDEAEEDVEEQQDDGKYRDRSKERREGKNLDEFEQAEELRQLGIEESKFLGGDIEHTHLVKGLDFALLQRVKAEIDSTNSETQEEQPKKSTTEEKRRFSCNSVLARKIHNQLVSTTSQVTKSTERFLPGRTTFVFDLTSTNTSSDLPTTYLRSKEDCPVLPNSRIFKCDAHILENIGSVMTYLRSGKQNAHKRKESSTNKQNENAINHKDDQLEQNSSLSQPRSTVDDIFPDVGEYIPEIPISKKQTESSKSENSASYFAGIPTESEPMQVDEVIVPKALINQIDNILKKQQETKSNESNNTFVQKNKNVQTGIQSDISELMEDVNQEKGEPIIDLKHSKKDPRELDPSFISDNYMECYPATYEISYSMYEGSDEEDLSKMDTGKKHKLTRASFTSEEAWSAYNNNREQLPKAAFQFGVKTTDGRKTRKNKKDKDRKLDNQLKKINEKIKDIENIRSAPVPTAQEVSKKMKYNT